MLTVSADIWRRDVELGLMGDYTYDHQRASGCEE